MLLLFGNACLTIGLRGSWLITLARAGRRIAHHGDSDPAGALRAAWSPAMGVATGLVAAHAVARPLLMAGIRRRVAQVEAAAHRR